MFVGRQLMLIFQLTCYVSRCIYVECDILLARFSRQYPLESAGLLTGPLPASPVRKGGVEGSYTRMAIFLTGKPRSEEREGFT